MADSKIPEEKIIDRMRLLLANADPPYSRYATSVPKIVKILSRKGEK